MTDRRELDRAQSAVSYAIGNLERVLDIEPFDRAGGQARLTEGGRNLSVRSEALGAVPELLLQRKVDVGVRAGCACSRGPTSPSPSP